MFGFNSLWYAPTFLAGTPQTFCFVSGDPLSSQRQKRGRKCHPFGYCWVHDQQHDARSPGDMEQDTNHREVYGSSCRMCQKGDTMRSFEQNVASRGGMKRARRAKLVRGAARPPTCTQLSSYRARGYSNPRAGPCVCAIGCFVGAHIPRCVDSQPYSSSSPDPFSCPGQHLVLPVCAAAGDVHKAHANPAR